MGFMRTILLGLLLALPGQEAGAKKYPWFSMAVRDDDHEVVVAVDGGSLKRTEATIVPTPLKEGANVVIVTFKVRPGRNPATSKGSSVRLGFSPSEKPGDDEVLELLDVVSRVAATEVVLKIEMKRSAPGPCASVERHWFDADRKKPNEEFEMERDLLQGGVASTVHREWAQSGTKKHEVRVRQGKMASAEYFDPSGKLGAEIKDGAGWARQWHDNGKICQESPY
jgi:hypothetical protein